MVLGALGAVSRVVSRVVPKAVPKAVQALKQTKAGSVIVGKLSQTPVGKVVASSGGGVAAKAVAAVRSTLGPGGAATVGKVGTKITGGIAKMPAPLRWAADLSGVKTLAGGMARVGMKAGTLGKVKTAAMLGAGGLGVKWTYGLLKPNNKQASPVTPDPTRDAVGLEDCGEYDPVCDPAGSGGVNEISKTGYGEYLKNPVVLGALGAVGLGVGAYALKKSLGRKAVEVVKKKISRKKKAVTPRGRRRVAARDKYVSAARAARGKYTFAALAKKWNKLSPQNKAKYEGKFSDYVKVHREMGIAAKETTTSRTSRKRPAGGSQIKTRTKRSTPQLKRQQTRMKEAAKKWRSYSGRLNYHEFMSKELKK